MKISLCRIVCCLSLLGVLVAGPGGTVSVHAATSPSLVTDTLLWCPVGVAPIANTDGCTDAYASFENLLMYLSAQEPDQSGVIWIGKGYDSGANDASITSFTLDGAANFPTMKDYELTLQAGWKGDSAGTILHRDRSELNATLAIVNWNAGVAVNDLFITEANGSGMNITTTGNVVLSNVHAVRNSSSGVAIDTTAGAGTVSIGKGNFSENGTGIYGGLGIFVLSKGAITLKNVTANDNAWEGAKFFNDTAADAQGDVALTGTNTFSGNASDGLMISSMGNINLRNIRVNGNGLTGAYLYNANGTGNITFTGTNTLTNNVGSGMYVYSNGVMTVHNLTATGNGSEGVLLMSGLGGSPNDIVLTGTNVFQGNGGAYPDIYYDLYTSWVSDFVQYRSAVTNSRTVSKVLSIDELPGSLPETMSFLSGLKLVQTGNEVVMSFSIPGELQDADAEFAVLYWDGSQWLNLEGAVFEDGRLVIDSGHKTEYGSFQATVNFGGIFALAQKISQ